MFGLIGKAICAVLSVLCFGYSGVCLFTNTSKQAESIVEAVDYNVHPENEGKLVMMRGKLTYKGTITEDPELGVKIKSPILQRHTEMFQYIPSSNDEKVRTAKKGWDKNSHPSFDDKYKHRYNNPPFPEGIPRTKDFACDLTMGDGNLKIDSDFVKALSYRQYVDFKDYYDHKMVGVKKLPSGKLPEHFRNLDNSYYRSHRSEDNSILEQPSLGKRDSRIGDIRIYYKAFKWSDDLPEFTVIGLQKDGKLLRQEGALFFDYRINDLQELKREMRSSNRSAMFGSFVCGLVLAAFALFI
ncbi:MAG: hypothetical protein Q4D07_06575 [Selenomonadaceae bacterium]|nr:hypothetical protein [Selenomonadaceae bacterium]